MDIYREIILDHYKNPRNYGQIKDADIKAQGDNPLCGDKITVYAKVSEDRLYDVSFQAEGCVISIASASIVFENIKGKRVDDILSMGRDEVEGLLRVKLGHNRIKCAVLPLKTLQQALAEKKKKE